MTAYLPLHALLALSLLSTAPSSAPASSPAAETREKAAAPAEAPRTQPPVLLSQVNPAYTEQARQAKISGEVKVTATIDENGVPQNVTVIHGLGAGLDEKAVEAVRQYRFKPATRDGVPVSTKVFINVNFQVL